MLWFAYQVSLEPTSPGPSPPPNLLIMSRTNVQSQEEHYSNTAACCNEMGARQRADLKFKIKSVKQMQLQIWNKHWRSSSDSVFKQDKVKRFVHNTENLLKSKWDMEWTAAISLNWLRTMPNCLSKWYHISIKIENAWCHYCFVVYSIPKSLQLSNRNILNFITIRRS